MKRRPVHIAIPGKAMITNLFTLKREGDMNMEMKNTTDNATYTVGNVTYNVDKIFQDEKKILPEEKLLLFILSHEKKS